MITLYVVPVVHVPTVKGKTYGDSVDGVNRFVGWEVVRGSFGPNSTSLPSSGLLSHVGVGAQRACLWQDLNRLPTEFHMKPVS